MHPLKEYSEKITKFLDELLPKSIRAAIVLGDPATSEVSTTSNMTDGATISLLEDGIVVLEKPDEVEATPRAKDNSGLN
jgi:hypothetical protein